MTLLHLLLVDRMRAYSILEAEYVNAVAEAATYRQILQETLALWCEDRTRLDGASQRLRQVMGLEEWH